MNAPAERATVLAVDDTPANLGLLAEVLGALYRVQLATHGAKALELAARRAPDLVLLDVMMPGMDGYEVCRRLKADPATADVPVIFLTALNAPEDEMRGFAAGGADFIAKPFTPATLLARVRTQLDLKSWRDALRDRNAWLQRELDARLDEVDALREATLFAMVGMAEFRDSDTGHHIERTQAYVQALGAWRRAHGPDEGRPDAADVEAMARAAPLHDIGKVATPDRILLKPGKLDADEWVVMKQHTVAGARLIERTAQRLGPQRAGALLRHGHDIARHHHERWDGSGYPDGLAGSTIPLSARLMAVADVYDALISRRPYKEPMSHDEALAHIVAGAGTHFDPLLVQGLQDCAETFQAIARRWND